MAAPVSSFKKFLRKQAPVTIIPLAHKNVKPTASLKGENSGDVDMSNGGLTDNMSEDVNQLDEIQYCAYDKDGKLVGNYKDLKTAKLLKPGHVYKPNKIDYMSGGKYVMNKEESEQLDELAKTPITSTKTDDLASRLGKYYNIDAKDKEAVGVYQKFHNHINNAYTKSAKGPDEKSKPDPVDAEAEKTHGDALAAGKKIDQLLGMHKAPTADFHVYAGLKHHPFETIKDEQGYDAGDEPVEAHIPGFAQASIDPSFAKKNAGKAGHVLKMQIKAGSRHGAYIGHVNNGGHDKEFLLRPGRKLRIDPKPEMHGDVHIWHGEMSGDK